MLDFLTAGFFKRVDESVHFFPFGKRGYEVEARDAARIARFMRAFWLITFALLVVAVLFLRDAAQVIVVIGGGALAMAIYYITMYMMVRGRPRSAIRFPRAERQRAFREALPVPLLASIALIGVAFIVVAVLMFRDMPHSWPIQIVFAAIGVTFIVQSIRLIRRNRASNG